MRRLATTLFIFGFCAWSQAQQWSTISTDSLTTIMERLSKKFREPDYQMGYKKLIFLNESDASPMSTEEGTFSRGKGKCYRSESTDQLVIQTPEIKMAVVYQDSSVLILPTDTLFDPLSIGSMNYEAQAANYVFEQQKTGSDVKLRFTSRKSGTGVDVIEFQFNKNWDLLKVTMLLSPGNYSMESMDDATLERPKQVVIYSPMKKLGTADSHLFEVQDWILPKERTYVLEQRKVGHFELEDLRYNPTNY